jgi:5'-nucleotidase/UDP-sugar diphosphatase
LALPGYASRGGDNYPPLNKHPNYVDTGYIDADVLREYIAKLP